MSKTTRKTVKVIGNQTYINKETGEVVDVQAINIEVGNADFNKIWLYYIAESLDLISNRKTQVLFHIMDNLNAENLYFGSQRAISERTGVSGPTVSATLKALQQINFISIRQNGVYAVNPNMIFKGGKEKQEKHMNVMIEYTEIK